MQPRDATVSGGLQGPGPRPASPAARAIPARPGQADGVVSVSADRATSAPSRPSPCLRVASVRSLIRKRGGWSRGPPLAVAMAAASGRGAGAPWPAAAGARRPEARRPFKFTQDRADTLPLLQGLRATGDAPPNKACHAVHSRGVRECCSAHRGQAVPSTSREGPPGSPVLCCRSGRAWLLEPCPAQ